jgi:hypothetical protein
MIGTYSVTARGLAVFATLLVLSSCGTKPVQDELTDPGRSIIPQASSSVPLASSTDGQAPPAPPSAPQEVNVQLPAEYSVAQVYNVNLDLTDTEEQIVVFKRRDDEGDAIRLLVLAFDPVRNAWIRAWEGATAANSVRSFTVYTDDLIGDHEMELVCFGINAAGEQTLDVFRRISSALGLGLSYEPVASIRADVSIEIAAVPRWDAYENMQTTSGASYPIIVRRRDTSSDDVFDLIQTTYYWRFDAGSYVAGEEVDIPSEEIQDSRLRDLFSGRVEHFEEFLDGPWYRYDGEELRLVSFSVADRSIVFFYSSHLQQAFIWDDSAKAVYGRDLQVLATNESLESVHKFIMVRAETLNQIRVTVQGTVNLSGTYQRLSSELQTTVASGGRSPARISERELRGPYRSDDGVELVFGDAEFAFRSAPLRGSGGYVLYEFGGVTILELQFVDVNRLPTQTVSYRVTYDEETAPTRIVRTITLTPGTVRIDGFSASGDPVLRMEQIESLEDTPGPSTGE